MITGGSRGVGAATAALIAERGWDVAITYRNRRDEADRLCADLQERFGAQSFAVHFDLEEPDSAERAVGEILERMTRIDTLIANAGMWRGGRLVGPATASWWWRLIETNLLGTQRFVTAALPHVIQQKGSIVVMSSVVGIVGFPGDTAYASGKAALIGFARSLAKELAADGVRVNVLAPGFTETDMIAEVSEAARNQIAERTLLGRFADPVEIGRAATFLGIDATFCTGAVLSVDGGWSI